MKKALLIVNLGTPDDPGYFSVFKYLREFLSDEKVLNINPILRFILVNFIICPTRSFSSSKIYKKVWDKDNGSPLLHNTKLLAQKLDKKLPDVDVQYAMRYQSPSIKMTLNKMLLKNPDEIVILPLFPHYAAATTMNSYDKIIFSYHGVPNSHVDNVYPDSMCSDNDCETKITNDNKFCYKATVYETTKILASKLGLEPNQYVVTFQSRLTNKWLSPFTDDVLQNLPTNGSKKVLVFSPAFTADCLETIIEIGDEYKELFYDAGGETLDYVPSLNYSDKWVDAIVDISNINEDKDVQE